MRRAKSQLQSGETVGSMFRFSSVSSRFPGQQLEATRDSARADVQNIERKISTREVKNLRTVSLRKGRFNYRFLFKSLLNEILSFQTNGQLLIVFLFNFPSVILQSQHRQLMEQVKNGTRFLELPSVDMDEQPEAPAAPVRLFSHLFIVLNFNFYCFL